MEAFVTKQSQLVGKLIVHCFKKKKKKKVLKFCVVFQRGENLFSDKLLEFYDWNLNVMRNPGNQATYTAVHTPFSGAEQVL